MSDEFDYVVVGAGSAGCVLAARLSEDPDVRVALLEAGGEDSAPEIRVPAIFPIMFKTELDWDLLGTRSRAWTTAACRCPAAGCSAAAARSTP